MLPTPKHACRKADVRGTETYLTMLGGGVFGNEDEWIISAIERAFVKTKSHGLDVRIVSFRHPKSSVAELVNRVG